MKCNQEVNTGFSELVTNLKKLDTTPCIYLNLYSNVKKTTPKAMCYKSCLKLFVMISLQLKSLGGLFQSDSLTMKNLKKVQVNLLNTVLYTLENLKGEELMHKLVTSESIPLHQTF